MNTQIIAESRLQKTNTGHLFEGRDFGGYPLSFFLVEAGINEGPKLHRHVYPEIFVVLEGTGHFTVGERELSIASGTIVIVPENTPHKFVNPVSSRLKLIGIHLSPEVTQTWQE